MKPKKLESLKKINLNSPEEKKRYNRKIFAIVALRYNLMTRILSFGRDQFWKKKLMSLLPIKENPNCLDIASGTGDITFALAEKYSDSEIIGIDLTQEMIELANKRNKNQKIKLMLGDMMNLPFNENTFDIITGGYAIRNAPDIQKTLQEIYRVLKIGGTAALLDFSKSSNALLQKIQLFLLKFWGNFWGWFFHKNGDVYSYIGKSLETFPDHTQFYKMLINTKFKCIVFKYFFFGMIQLILLKK